MRRLLHLHYVYASQTPPGILLKHSWLRPPRQHRVCFWRDPGVSAVLTHRARRAEQGLTSLYPPRNLGRGPVTICAEPTIGGLKEKALRPPYYETFSKVKSYTGLCVVSYFLSGASPRAR